jgi:hypothetical protein
LDTDDYLDGNAAAGELSNIFAMDVTSAEGQCALRRQRLRYRLGRSHQIQNQMTRVNDPRLDFT